MRRVLVSLVAVMTWGWTSAAAEELPFESERWNWSANEQRIEEHLGRQSLYLKGGIGWIEGVELTNGMIEFDLSFTGERGFVGGPGLEISTRFRRISGPKPPISA